MIVSIVLSFILTLLFGFEDIKTEKYDVRTKNVEISSPAEGTIKELVDIDDDVFSKEVLGKGFAVIPENGNVVSPVSGQITAMFPTLHAFGIMSEDGVEVLVHIGIDTVTLNGEGFNSSVKVGENILKGELLAQVDLNFISSHNLSTEIIVIVTNTKEYDELRLIKHAELKLGEVVFVGEKHFENKHI